MENNKVIFWNVDTQKDFMNPDGALYVEGAESIKPNLLKLTRFARVNHILVVNTADWHNKSDEELSNKPDFINTFPDHCMANTDGAMFVVETEPWDFDISLIDYREQPRIYLNKENIVILKNKFDVFEGNPHTEKFLDLINPDIAVVYGVATNFCVNYAVLGLEKRGISVYVVEDAIKELPNLPLDEIYYGWKNKNIHKFSVDQILRKLNDY